MRIEPCYPNFTKKAVTFTIDDGNVEMDRRFLSIVSDAGLRGTFNLCAHWLSALSPEGYRALYRGHEIANHMAYHPMALCPDVAYTVADEPFCAESADPEKLYPTDREGLYHMHAHRWLYAAERETYLALAEESRLALEGVFGEGSIKSFVYPYFKQKDEEIFRRLAESGKYYGIRRTGTTRGEDGFALPRTLPEWTYTADASCLLEVGRRYDVLADDGELKFFCFGVHSVDFENEGKWEDLSAFTALCAAHPDKYYFATVGEIFAYADAVSRLRAEGTMLENPSSIPLSLLADGCRVMLPPQTSLSLQ